MRTMEPQEAGGLTAGAGRGLLQRLLSPLTRAARRRRLRRAIAQVVAAPASPPAATLAPLAAWRAWRQRAALRSLVPHVNGRSRLWAALPLGSAVLLALAGGNLAVRRASVPSATAQAHGPGADLRLASTAAPGDVLMLSEWEGCVGLTAAGRERVRQGLLNKEHWTACPAEAAPILRAHPPTE